jgi:hypothetical protein
MSRQAECWRCGGSKGQLKIVIFICRDFRQRVDSGSRVYEHKGRCIDANKA